MVSVCELECCAAREAGGVADPAACTLAASQDVHIGDRRSGPPSGYAPTACARVGAEEPRTRRTDLAGHLRLDVQENGDDEAVQTQHFGENENEDHSDEEAGLLRGAAHTGVAHDADGEAGRQTAEADRQAGAEVHEPAARHRKPVSQAQRHTREQGKAEPNKINRHMHIKSLYHKTTFTIILLDSWSSCDSQEVTGAIASKIGVTPVWLYVRSECPRPVDAPVVEDGQPVQADRASGRRGHSLLT